MAHDSHPIVRTPSPLQKSGFDKSVVKVASNLFFNVLSPKTWYKKSVYKKVDGEYMPVRKTTRVIVFSISKGSNEPLFLLLFNGKHQYRQNPQGGIDPGESYLQAGVRELQEETGIGDTQFIEGSHTKQEYRSQRKGKPQWSVVHGVAAKVPYQEIIVLNEEDGHTDYGRFTYNEACERLTRFPEQLTMFQDVCHCAGLDL